MDKKAIEKKLAELMDAVPECEGLIAAHTDGKVIVGQTLTEMDHGSIAIACSSIIKDANTLGVKTGKGALKDTTIELESGFAVIVSSASVVLIALAGTDGRPSLGLLKRNLTSIIKS
ncbi:MAG: roadblock/LC7 domain-containing protein [Promethearchaeota archaeon]